MQAPFFFIEEIKNDAGFITLNEETSKHVVQVLRMKNGEQILLTDGKGNLLNCEINDNHKKKCIVKIQERSFKEQGTRKISITISLLKNANRFEWFLEKVTELGITEIAPTICERTERQHFRSERMKNILVSAMLQSQQVWLPILHEPVSLKEIISQSHQSQKFIAHCMDDAKVSLSDAMNAFTSSQIILIGPEGDFTKDEINFALQNHFVPVTLGETRLRTETAGIVAAAILATQ
ncbi:MAG TPA: RsmE family RNA methyltransferase [Puia sp.]|nr:RsmE family RNA methyltransferase [Puia sp.]